MKHYLPKLLSASLLLALFTIFSTNPTKACDRSSAQLGSVVFGSGFVDITVTTYLGGGITGTSKGADNPTRTFAYGVWGSGTLVNLSFTPSVTSDTTKTTYLGSNNPGVFGTSFAIAYIYNGIDFTCVSSTPVCGNRHTDTLTIVIRTNELPDSIRVLGIEGSGLPFSGCYPDADMLLNLTAFPVIWAGFEATKQEYGVDLEWTTASESNNDYFQIQRSVNGGSSYETIGEMDAVGNSQKSSSYSFTDPRPSTGTNFYKIVQVDIDGGQTESDVRQLEYEAPSGMNWTSIGPNPVRDFVSVGYYVDQNQPLTLSVIDLQGRLLMTRNVEAFTGTNMLQLDLSGFSNGFYSLQLKGSKGMLEQRLIKM